MTKISLESLGLSQEDLAEKLVDRIAENLLTSIDYDEEGGRWCTGSPFAKKLDRLVKDRLDQIVNEMAEKHVLPKVNTIVEEMVLQETNKWGEKRGQILTFKEYLVQRAEAWMSEPVNFEGKSKGTNNYSWEANNTRVGYMIHHHLQYEIGTAMKNALSAANTSIAKGLHEAIRIQINQVAAKLKVDVNM